ncbi:MAG: HEAT repeat domain-containing protein [Patescibacteria group bacterium]
MKINKNIIIYVVAIGVGVFFFLFLSTCTLIGTHVKQKCEIAQAKYEGDCVEALSTLVDDEKNDYETRNSAIWALGQLGDERGLVVLNKYYTGDIPDREPLDEGISQYELKKAIKLDEGGFNATAFVWRSEL